MLSQLRRIAARMRQKDVTVCLYGLKITMPNRYVGEYAEREHEPLSHRYFWDQLKPGMKVLDVGAHIGLLTALAAKKVGPSGLVYAIEAGHENIRYIDANVSQNALTNVKAYNIAAGPCRAKREFHITGSSNSHSFYPHPNTGTVRKIIIQQEAMDDLVAPPLDVIKIDVEGAEIDVLQGLKTTLATSPDVMMLLEWFPQAMRNGGRDPMDLPRYVEALGFSVKVIDERENRLCAVSEIDLAPLPFYWNCNLLANRR